MTERDNVIPKIFHRVVPAQVPERFERFWQAAQELHPDYEFRSWQDPLDPADFELGFLFDECSSGAQLAGLVRLEVLWRHGGVYLDMDIEVLRRFDDLLGVPAFVGTEDGVILTDALLGAEQGHAAFRACLDRLQSTSMEAGALATGPLLVTSVMSGRDDVLVLPPRFFYPAKFSGLQESREAIAAEGTSHAIHHWHRSWNGARLLNLGENRADRVAQYAETTRRATRRTVKQVAVRARRLWDGLALATRPSRVSEYDSEFSLLTTSDELPLLVPRQDGLNADLVRTGIVRAGLADAVLTYAEPADSVLVSGDPFGYAAVLAGRRVGRHGTVFLHTGVGPDRAARSNLTFHRLDRSDSPIVEIANARALAEATLTPRHSLPPRLVVASSATESVELLDATYLRPGAVPAPAALLIDVPDERSGHSSNGLDELLGALVAKWNASVSVISDRGAAMQTTLDHVLVERGFASVLVTS